MIPDALLTFCLLAFSSLYDAFSALAVPAVFFLVLAVAVKRSRLIADLRRAGPETVLNLKLIAFNAVLMTPLFGVLSQGMATAFDAWGLVVPGSGTWAALPPLAVVVIAVFVGDFTGYWRHRLEHSRYLWPAHAVHHSDTEMTWLTLERFHPFNRLSTVMIDSAVLLALGFPAWAVIANNIVRHYYGFFIHADLSDSFLATYDRFGLPGRLFVSPTMHRWHHAADPAYYQANFATVFSLFDRAFGTYKCPGPCDVALGVSDRMTTSLSSQLLYAFRPGAYRRRSKNVAGKIKAPALLSGLRR